MCVKPVNDVFHLLFITHIIYSVPIYPLHYTHLKITFYKPNTINNGLILNKLNANSVPDSLILTMIHVS